LSTSFFGSGPGQHSASSVQFVSTGIARDSQAVVTAQDSIFCPGVQSDAFIQTKCSGNLYPSGFSM